jgi:SAM-dependent methyltransferase
VTREGFDPELFQPLAEVEEDSFWFRARSRLIVSTVRERFPDARSFFELGCGSGVVLAALHEGNPQLRLVGGDLYSEGLEIARRRLPDVELVELDGRALPYEEAFDVIGAFDVLEHIDDDENVLRQMVRAVRPGGGVFILVPQHPWLWSTYDEVVEHRRRYTRGDLVAKARRAGVQVDHVTSFVTFLLPAMVLARVVDRLRGQSDPLAHLKPGRLNGTLEWILDREHKLIARGVSLPVGGTLMLVGRRA